MRKIYIIFLLVIMVYLGGCSKTNINSTVYISSIGFEVEDGKLKAYFLSNPLTNISRGNDGSGDKDDSEYVSVTSESVYDVFLKAEQSLLSPLNYRHIKTVIFHKDLFETKYIGDFFEYMKSALTVSYNFYVFATKEKIEEIYSFKNPEQISYQYSVLSSPNLLNFHKYGTEKLHFLDFANDYYDEGRYLHIPTININKTWKEKTTIEVGGFLVIDENKNMYDNTQYAGMFYLYDSDIILFNTDLIMYRVLGYKMTMKEKKGVFTLIASYDDIYIFGKGSKEHFNEELKKELHKFLLDYIKNQGGLYLIEEYNYLNKKALNVLLYNIEIKTNI